MAISKHIFFAGALLVLVAVLSWFIYSQEQVVQSNTTVVLATRPIDPRDLFRGEYVILRYAIETDERVTSFVEEHPDSNDFYLVLDTTAATATVTDIRLEEPTGEVVWLKGERAGWRGVEFPDLEQFYVPEGAGTPIENLRDKLHVEVAIKGSEARVITLLDEHLAPIDPADMIER